MLRRRYPRNWEELARACKERAGWKCEDCGIEQYTIVISAKGTPYFIYLHAAHVHHDPANPQPELVALCVACHARMDSAHREREARVHLDMLKHLRLLLEQGVVMVRREGV